MISNDTVELLAEFGIRLDGRDLVVPGWSLNLRDIRSANVARITTAATVPILMITSGALCVLSSFGAGGGTRGMLGIGLLLTTAIWWFQEKPNFEARLHMAAGETNCPHSQPAQFPKP